MVGEDEFRELGLDRDEQGQPVAVRGQVSPPAVIGIAPADRLPAERLAQHLQGGLAFAVAQGAQHLALINPDQHSIENLPK